jgi:hypothetical protein
MQIKALDGELSLAGENFLVRETSQEDRFFPLYERIKGISKP